jgi:small-conductance mechanosensitive channel
MADLAWISARDYHKAQFLEQNGKLGAAAAAIQRERDEAEAAQHSTRILLEEEEADNEENRHLLSMAEEREKKLLNSLIDLANWVDFSLDLSDSTEDSPRDEIVRASRPNSVWLEGKKRLAESRTVIGDWHVS